MTNTELVRYLEEQLEKAKRGEQPRTQSQNRALHKYLTLVSEALNDAGLSIHAVLKPGVEVDWTPTLAKELLWRTVQKAVTGKESTTDLSKHGELTLVWETMNRHLGKLGIESIPFPSYEAQRAGSLTREPRP